MIEMTMFNMVLAMMAYTTVSGSTVRNMRYESDRGILCLDAVFKGVCSGSCATENFTIDASQLSIRFPDNFVTSNFTSDMCDPQIVVASNDGSLTDSVCTHINKTFYTQV